MKQIINKSIKNPIVLYLLSRYIVFGIQFITQIILIKRMGQYNFGIWGIILLWVSIGLTINFGINSCAEVLLVKKEAEREEIIICTSIILNLLLISIPLLFVILSQVLEIAYVKKYNLGNLIYYIPVITIFFHLNNLFALIQRIKNQYFLYTLFQSLFPLACFCISFFGKDRVLLVELVNIYLISGLLLCFIGLYYNRSCLKIQFISSGIAKELFKRGFFLFIYSSGYLLIMLTTKFIISYYYKVEEFGAFVFALQFGNAAMLLINSFLGLIQPKLIEMMSMKDPLALTIYIKRIHTIYSTTVSLLVYMIIFAGSLFIRFFLKQRTSEFALIMILLTLLTNSIVCPYNIYLIAQKKEKTIARITFVTCILNCILLLCLVHILNLSYEFVILGTLLSYLFYVVATIYAAACNIKKIRLIKCFSIAYPLRLFIPFVTALIISFLKIQSLLFIPLLLMIICNIREIVEVLNKVKTIIEKPAIFELNS